MRIKTSLTLALCNALLWATLGGTQPLTDEKPTVNQQQVAPVSSKEQSATQGSGATTGRTLGERLTALEQAHSIRILLHPAVNTAEQVADERGDLPPEIALGLLLHSYDFFLQYNAGQEEGTKRLKRVWVFPRNEGDRQQIVPEQVVEATRQPVSRDHAAELRNAMARSNEEAQSVLAGALDEEDENTRHNVLEAALHEGFPISPLLLERALLHDQSEVMRAAAFDALILRAESESLDVRAIIDLALQDPSPLVQSRALDLLEALDAPVEPPQPEQEPVSE